MRFDFDPDNEREDHPLVHLHTQFEHARLHVNEVMFFPTFIKKVFRSFYLDQWIANTDLESIHEQSFDQVEGRFDPVPYCFQLS